MGFEADTLTLIILLVTGFGAGLIDAMAGGGGIITLPVMLSVGMSPVEVLGTNKLQACFGSFAAATYFIRKKMVNLKAARPMVLTTFLGAALGTLCVQQIDSEILAKLMPGLLIVIAGYFAFSPKVSNEDQPQRITPALFTGFVAPLIGFYDGFFGPGTGTFFTLAFVALAGYGLAKATAHTKLLNFTSNITALAFFVTAGHILWVAGLTMALGQLIGGQIGARLVLSKGAKLVRPVIIVMTLVISAKLLASQFGLI